MLERGDCHDVVVSSPGREIDDVAVVDTWRDFVLVDHVVSDWTVMSEHVASFQIRAATLSPVFEEVKR